MKFILSQEKSPDLETQKIFSCLETKKNQEIRPPVSLTKKQLTQKVQAGEEFHILYKVSCRWEVGPKLVIKKSKSSCVLTLMEE